MWYWDEAGLWNVTVYAEDNQGASALNKTTTFQYNLLEAFTISPNTIYWTSLSPGQTNQTAANFTTLNNTGNAEIASGNIQIEAVNLYGPLSYYIDVGNITASNNSLASLLCNLTGTGNQLQNSTFVGITGANLSRGNLSEGGGKAQETIYYCMTKVPKTIPSGVYDTSTGGAWTIKIIASIIFIFTPQLKKKKRKVKKKQKRTQRTEKDNLVKALKLISEELKEEYTKNKAEIRRLLVEEIRKDYRISKKEIVEIIGLKEKLTIPTTIFSSKLGALESVVKYMKENLSFSYSEIAKLLKRNEKTIWTAYNKARKKMPQALKQEKPELQLPISIFENRKLTILESIIIYLRFKKLKYVEIAKLLNRDQRNIWTIYSRAVKKIKGKF